MISFELASLFCGIGTFRIISFAVYSDYMSIMVIMLDVYSNYTLITVIVLDVYSNYTFITVAHGNERLVELTRMGEIWFLMLYMLHIL